jgi:hypothetical protein
MRAYIKFLFVFIVINLIGVVGMAQCQWERFKAATNPETEAGRALSDAIDKDAELIDFWEILDNDGIRDIENQIARIGGNADPDIVKKYITDIKNDLNLAREVSDNLELVQAWKIIKNNGDNNLANLATDLDELNLVSKNLNEIASVGGYKTWKSLEFDNKVNKLTASSSINISWKNIDDKNLIWASPNNNKLSTAKSFADETNTNLYDAILDDGSYVKIDINDGRILLGNTEGAYQAFAILNDADLGNFKSSVLDVSDNVFNTQIINLINDSSRKLKLLSGAISRPLTIAGESISLSANKVNTLLGRYRPDISNLFEELGSFKNVGLGETLGGINILNKPDHYYDASSWWDAYNKPWLNNAIDRGDDIYLATIPKSSDDILDATGNLKGAYAQELNHLASRNYKPKNITEKDWIDIRRWLGFKHPDWVEVIDIRTKLLARKPHVLEIENITTKANGQKGFTGCHSKIALDGFAVKNSGAIIEYMNKNLDAASGVYEAQPVIKMPNGEEYIKLNNNGKSTFFPDSWDETKILDEVEYSIINNQGQFPNGAPNEYYGYSKNGKVKIHFYLNPNGNINSFFPSLAPL